MLIGIDWDKTYTADAAYWYAVMKLGQDYGHEYLIVTGRNKSHAINRDSGCCAIDVLYTDGELKRGFAEKAGYQVDIWVDDEPGYIEPCRKLDGW